MKNRLPVSVLAVLAVVFAYSCAGVAAADPTGGGRKPDQSEQGRVLRPPVVKIPWWMQQPGESDLHYFFRVPAMWFATPRFSDETPGDEPGDAPPGDVDPCPNC